MCYTQEQNPSEVGFDLGPPESYTLQGPSSHISSNHMSYGSEEMFLPYMGMSCVLDN